MPRKSPMTTSSWQGWLKGALLVGSSVGMYMLALAGLPGASGEMLEKNQSERGDINESQNSQALMEFENKAISHQKTTLRASMPSIPSVDERAENSGLNLAEFAEEAIPDVEILELNTREMQSINSTENRNETVEENQTKINEYQQRDMTSSDLSIVATILSGISVFIYLVYSCFIVDRRERISEIRRINVRLSKIIREAAECIADVYKYDKDIKIQDERIENGEDKAIKQGFIPSFENGTMEKLSDFSHGELSDNISIFALAYNMMGVLKWMVRSDHVISVGGSKGEDEQEYSYAQRRRESSRNYIIMQNLVRLLDEFDLANNWLVKCSCCENKKIKQIRQDISFRIVEIYTFELTQKLIFNIHLLRYRSDRRTNEIKTIGKILKKLNAVLYRLEDEKLKEGKIEVSNEKIDTLSYSIFHRSSAENNVGTQKDADTSKFRNCLRKVNPCRQSRDGESAVRPSRDADMQPSILFKKATWIAPNNDDFNANYTKSTATESKQNAAST